MRDVITTHALAKAYGRRPALNGLDLQVAQGEVYGFLGPNGAGKTTTIRLLLDVIRPSGGHARVLGMDPRSDGVELRRRIGYLPGDFVVEDRQTSRQLLRHLAALRGGVHRDRIGALAERLGLDLEMQIRALSKGNRQKVGLVQAFMHDPELLILDEPTSGLDPLVQNEFQGMVREAVASGRTVFMSSHVLSEVQAMADRVGIIREGVLVAVDRVEGLRQRSVRRVEVVFDHPLPPDGFAALDGVEDVTVDGSILTCRVVGRVDTLIKALAAHTVVSIVSEEPDLDELFLDFYQPEVHA